MVPHQELVVAHVACATGLPLAEGEGGRPCVLGALEDATGLLLRLSLMLDAAVALCRLAQVAARLVVFVSRGFAGDGMVLAADGDRCLLISRLLARVVIGVAMVPGL